MAKNKQKLKNIDETPTPPSTANNSTINDKSQSQNSNTYQLLRPVLSMPPVVLMGGGGNDNMFGYYTIPISPIVEMPPSPSPTTFSQNNPPLYEYPDDDEDDDDTHQYVNDEDDDDGDDLIIAEDVYDNISEVRWFFHHNKQFVIFV